jgi:hypothetical protein
VKRTFSEPRPYNLGYEYGALEVFTSARSALRSEVRRIEMPLHHGDALDRVRCDLDAS